MNFNPKIEMYIGIAESQSQFLARLSTKYNGYLTITELQREARFQSIERDIEVATTVTQLRPPMMRMVRLLANPQ